MNNIKLICVAGRTCSGKDSLTTEAVKKSNEFINMVDKGKKDYYKIITSYTTRPIRQNESADSHIFITEEDYESNFKDKLKIAETVINGYHYFVLKEQIEDIINSGSIPVYIIDPNGIDYIVTNHIYEEDELYKIYIYAGCWTRRHRYIARSITDRDLTEAETIKLIAEFIKRNESEDYQFNTFDDECRMKYIDQNFRANSFDLWIVNDFNSNMKDNIITMEKSLLCLYNGI